MAEQLEHFLTFTKEHGIGGSIELGNLDLYALPYLLDLLAETLEPAELVLQKLTMGVTDRHLVQLVFPTV